MSRGWLQRSPNKGYDPPLGCPTPTSEKTLLPSTRVNKRGAAAHRRHLPPPTRGTSARRVHPTHQAEGTMHRPTHYFPEHPATSPKTRMGVGPGRILPYAPSGRSRTTP